MEGDVPIYEYQCQKCSKVTEELAKFSDPPRRKCPHCGGKVEKLMSLGSFHLKGSGWYVTDYKGKNSSTAETPKADKAEKTETKKETKKADKSGD
jgi:putative FmdB family regulatory protein